MYPMLVSPTIANASTMMRATPVAASVDTKATLTSSTDAQVHLRVQFFFPVVFVANAPFVFKVPLFLLGK